MNAVIMAGGFGTRLRPLTVNIPKPMVPMMNKPMMEHIVDLLRLHGYDNLVCTLFYQPEVIEKHFETGASFGVNMKYVRAEADYGTAGSVRNAMEHLQGRFLVISGDVFTDIDLGKALAFHIEKKAKVTIILTRAKNPLQYGVVITDDQGRIVRFLEKPSWGEVFSDTINTGIYIIELDVMNLIPHRQEFDFSKNLFPLLMERKEGLFGYIAEGYWRDVGNLNEYQDAHFDGLAGLVQVRVDGIQRGTLTIGEGTVLKTVDDNLGGRVLIGKNCSIAEDVRIVNSVIGDNCIIEPGAVIRNSVLWNNVVVERNAELSFDVVGERCSIGARATILDNVFISDRCVIGANARLLPNLKLWPEKKVEEGAILNRSLVWEDRWLRDLFTDARITGLSNIEMNPEFGAKLGAAWGATLGPGRVVVTSRDADNVSRMINRALICGLISAGVQVHDLRATSIPLVRHELNSGREGGGIHVRKSPYDKRMTDIIFFDATGRDLPIGKTKTIERLFFGEDFQRSTPDRVGTISFPERTTEMYREQFLAALDLDAMRNARFRIVIDYSNGVASTIFPFILGSFECQAIALNAHLDPRKLTRDPTEINRSLQQLSHIVTSLEYDLGCMIDAGGERITVVDENGTVIDNDRLLSLVTEIFLQGHPDAKKIAVPITASAEIDAIASARGIQVVKTRNTHLAMMEAAMTKEINFVGGTKGGFIFTDYFFAADGMFSLAKILEMMAKTGCHFGDLDATLQRFVRERRQVRCPWEAKGKIMRRIMEETENEQRELVDGVRIVYNGRKPGCIAVLLMPDKEQPLFHLIAEGTTEASARSLADAFERDIIKWRDS